MQQTDQNAETIPEQVPPPIPTALRPTPQQLELERLAADLAANESGVLSPRQRWRYVAVRAAEHGIGVLTVMFVFALGINALGLAPDLVTIGAVYALIMGVALVSLAISSRPAFEARVKSVRGTLQHAVIAPPYLPPHYCLTVGGQLFYVTRTQFDALSVDEDYTAYYLPRAIRIGGPHLLSAVLTEPAAR